MNSLKFKKLKGHTAAIMQKRKKKISPNIPCSRQSILELMIHLVLTGLCPQHLSVARPRGDCNS
jgi:hypothetical protein